MIHPTPGGAILLRDVRPFGEAAVDLLLGDGRILGCYPLALRGMLPAVLPPAVDVTECQGAIALPAFVDLHTHLREPGGSAQETIASGLAAAAAGGFAEVFAMANTDPVTDTADRVRWQHEHTPVGSPVRLNVVGAVTRGLAGRELADLDGLADAGVRVFSDDGRCVEDAGLMRRALKFAARRGVVIAQHAQSAGIAGQGQLNPGHHADRLALAPWPASAEASIIARDAVLAAETGGRLHVYHVSTALAVEAIAWAKQQQWPVTAEATPHHLLLSDDLTVTGDPRFKVNPPLRSAADIRALRDGLAGGIVDSIGTDHAPHTRAAKTCGWGEAAFGMSGLETALAAAAEAMITTGHCDWRRLSACLTDAPARIGGVTSVSSLEPGSPADLVLVTAGEAAPVDPDALISRGRNTPFPGMVFGHAVTAVYLGGRRVV